MSGPDALNNRTVCVRDLIATSVLFILLKEVTELSSIIVDTFSHMARSTASSIHGTERLHWPTDFTNGSYSTQEKKLAWDSGRHFSAGYLFHQTEYPQGA
jgi:hypothetical protein